MGRLEVRGWRKIYHANTNEQKAGKAILILGKTDFGERKLLWMKRALHNEKAVNSLRRQQSRMCMHPTTEHQILETVQFKKVVQLQGEVDESTLIVEDFNIPL